MSENAMRLRAETGDFIRVFEDNISKQPTHLAAYEATERIHENLTGHRRYRDYLIFKTIKSRAKKKKRG